MEENRKFIYIEQFLDALAAVDSYEAKGTATYALCYYAITGEYPEEATDADKMYVGANMKMIEGQEKWRNEKTEGGKSSGNKKQQISDEELTIAIKELYQQLGRVPREPELLRYTNTSATIRKREPWKDRNKICGVSIDGTKIVEEENKKCVETNFVERNKNCVQKQIFNF